MKQLNTNQGWWRRQDGGVAVEFAMLFVILAMLVFGVIDFGHAWYMNQVITNASREGARYGTRYGKVPGNVNMRIKPVNLSPTIGGWIKSQYESLLPADAEMTVTPGGAGYTTGLAGDDLSVTITATKRWFVLGSLMPGWAETVQLRAVTVMKVE